jgi:hypothetical protein
VRPRLMASVRGGSSRRRGSSRSSSRPQASQVRLSRQQSPVRLCRMRLEVLLRGQGMMPVMQQLHRQALEAVCSSRTTKQCPEKSCC